MTELETALEALRLSRFVLGRTQTYVTGFADAVAPAVGIDPRLLDADRESVEAALRAADAVLEHYPAPQGEAA